MHSVSSPAYSKNFHGSEDPNPGSHPPGGGTSGLEAAARHVRQLAGQIVELARSGIPPQEFYPQFLARLVEALGTYRGVLWQQEGPGQWERLYEVDRSSSEMPLLGELKPDWQEQPWHLELLSRAMRVPVAAPGQRDSAGGERSSANPTPWLLLLAPIQAGQGQAVVVELLQRPEASLAAPRQLRFLAQMTEWANRYFRRRRVLELEEELGFWRQVEVFAQQVHARLDPEWVAYTFVNEGRQLVGCDRLSLLTAEGDRCRVLALSGASEFDPRSPALRLLSRLVRVVLAGNEPLYYPGGSEGLPPQIEPLLESYVDRTHTKALAILPLWPTWELRPKSIDEAGAGPGGEETGSASSGPLTQARPIGALVLEQFASAEIPVSMRTRLEAVARHGQTALSHSLRYDGIFLRTVWEALGRHGWVVWARTLSKWVWAAAAVGLILVVLILTPTRLEMEARGTLQPVIQQDVFAGMDGRVEKVLVAHGDRVRGPNLQTSQPGSLLCELRNYELEEELARLAGERATLEERLAAISRALLERQLPAMESDRLSAEQASVRQQLQSLDGQLALCRRKQEQLFIYSPIEGQVITWDVAGLLLHRPVVRGDRLLRIAQTDGPWQLELEVPEDRIGHVRRAWQSADGPLRVRFLLATDPSKTYEGQLIQIDSNAETRQPEGRSVLARVQIDRNQVSPLLPGGEVRARIDCGRCSLGYRWFHDLAAWLRRIWFRW